MTMSPAGMLNQKSTDDRAGVEQYNLRVETSGRCRDMIFGGTSYGLSRCAEMNGARRCTIAECA